MGEPIASGPLEDFLTARWGLHERHLGVDWYVPNVHEPWPLHRAELLELDDTLLARAGFPGLAGRPPDHVAASPGVSVRFGLPAALAAPGDPHRRAYWRSANTATAAAWASTMTAPSTVRRSHAPTTRPRLASTQAELPSTTTQVAGRGITGPAGQGDQPRGVDDEEHADAEEQAAREPEHGVEHARPGRGGEAEGAGGDGVEAQDGAQVEAGGEGGGRGHRCLLGR